MNKYLRRFKVNEEGMGDIYTIFDAFNISGVRANAVKKLLMAGNRGYKDTSKDLNEAVACIQRELELMDEN
jgi:hypothetical protein